MTVRVASLFGNIPLTPDVVDVTSRGDDFGRAFSPFLLGPVALYDGLTAKNVENAWQYSKVYMHHDDPVTMQPSMAWWKWAKAGWNSARANRYPMGKGSKPIYSWWDGERLTYVEARKKIYIPLYRRAVLEQGPWEALMEMYDYYSSEITLLDFDAYDHRALGYSWEDVINDPERKMGHAFVLAMMLEGHIK